jgi:hypothetical protein
MPFPRAALSVSLLIASMSFLLGQAASGGSTSIAVRDAEPAGGGAGTGQTAGRGLDLRMTVHDGIIEGRVFFRWDKEAELAASLRDGLESRITLTVRLFERKRAILPFFRDVRMVEKNLAKSAFFDFLTQQFVVESDEGTRDSFRDPKDMLASFFLWGEIPLMERDGLQEPFITARVRFDPVALLPPLTILSLFGMTGTYTSPWIRGELGPS